MTGPAINAVLQAPLLLLVPLVVHRALPLQLPLHQAKSRRKVVRNKAWRHKKMTTVLVVAPAWGICLFKQRIPPPKELFVGSTPDTKIRGTEITVSALVGVRLFPQIKFVCNPTVELMFCRDARSICGVVMSECSPPVNITEQDWWEHARKWISKQVSVLRNSKNTQMKWSFMGKH